MWARLSIGTGATKTGSNDPVMPKGGNKKEENKMDSVIVLTQSGHPPTERFMGKLLKDHLGSRDEEIKVKAKAGPAYLNRQVMISELESRDLQAVIVVKSLPFPPSAYESTALTGNALYRFKTCLQDANDNKDSWNVAVSIIEAAKKEA